MSNVYETKLAFNGYGTENTTMTAEADTKLTFETEPVRPFIIAVHDPRTVQIMDGDQPLPGIQKVVFEASVDTIPPKLIVTVPEISEGATPEAKEGIARTIEAVQRHGGQIEFRPAAEHVIESNPEEQGQAEATLKQVIGEAAFKDPFTRKDRVRRFDEADKKVADAAQAVEGDPIELFHKLRTDFVSELAHDMLGQVGQCVVKQTHDEEKQVRKVTVEFSEAAMKNATPDRIAGIGGIIKRLSKPMERIGCRVQFWSDQHKFVVEIKEPNIG